MTDGDVVGLAIDLERGRLHVARNGTWVDGPPDADAAGITIRRPVRPFVVAVSISRIAGSGESDSWTVNFGATAFAYPIPAGYRSYDGRQHSPSD